MKVKISSVLAGFLGLALVISFAIFIWLLAVTLGSTALTALNSNFQSILNLNTKIARNFVERSQTLTRALGEDFMVVKALVDLKSGFESSDSAAVEKIFKKPDVDRSKIMMGDGVEMYEFMHEAHHTQITKYMGTVFFRDLLLVSPDGTVIYSFRKQDEFGLPISKTAETISKMKFLKTQLNGLNKRGQVRGGIYQELSGELGVLAATPVMVSGKAAGHVVTMTPLSYLGGLFDDVGIIGETGKIFATNAKGKPVVWRTKSKTRPYNKTPDGLLSLSKPDKVIARSINLNGEGTYVAGRPLVFGKTTYHLFVTQSTDEVFSLLNSLQTSLTIVGAVIVVVALIIVVVALRRISKPLVKVTSQLKSLAVGETKDIQKVSSRLQEIQQISDALVIFRESLDERDQLETAAIEDTQKEAEKQRELASLLKQFRGIMESSLESITNKSSEMKLSANELLNVATSTTEQADSARDSSQSATSNVVSVANAATELSSSIQQVSKHIHIAGQTIEAANDAAESTNESVEELSAATQEIGNVLDIIRGIAQKINLLALNATIEAVHAGEMGKSFSIVANEVKQLSNDTSVAIDQISKQIQSVKSSADYSVGLIKIITHSVGDVSDAAKAISEAVIEQMEATNEISNHANSVAEESRYVADNVDSVAMSIKQTSEVAGHVGGVSDEFTQLANRLSGLVGSILGDMENDLADRKNSLRQKIGYTEELPEEKKSTDDDVAFF